jgi:hypothetical protein
MRSRFAKVLIWAALGWKAQAHPKRVAEWPADAPEPTNYWFGHPGGGVVELRPLVRMARKRWRIEQDYRELKEELGLDHFKGRHRLGWHHPVTLVSMAFAFLRLGQARAKKTFGVARRVKPSDFFGFFSYRRAPVVNIDQQPLNSPR